MMMIMYISYMQVNGCLSGEVFCKDYSVYKFVSMTKQWNLPEQHKYYSWCQTSSHCTVVY